MTHHLNKKFHSEKSDQASLKWIKLWTYILILMNLHTNASTLSAQICSILCRLCGHIRWTWISQFNLIKAATIETHINMYVVYRVLYRPIVWNLQSWNTCFIIGTCTVYTNCKMSDTWVPVAVGCVAGIAVYGLIYRYRNSVGRKSWKEVGRIEHIFVHPIKACRGIDVTEAICTELGMKSTQGVYDR